MRNTYNTLKFTVVLFLGTAFILPDFAYLLEYAILGLLGALAFQWLISKW